MKNLENDDVHSKLMRLLGELASQTSSIQEAVNALLKQSVILPTALIARIEDFIGEHKEFSFTAKEDFVVDAIDFRLGWLKNDNERLEIPREQYNELNKAVKEMGTPFVTAEEFIQSQITDVLEKYGDYTKSKRQR